MLHEYRATISEICLSVHRMLLVILPMKQFSISELSLPFLHSGFAGIAPLCPLWPCSDCSLD